MSKQSNLVNSSQDITVDGSGNVGIGTISPGANTKLDVIGNITIDSAFAGDNGLCFRRGFEGSDNNRIYADDTGLGRKGGLRLAAYDGIAFGTGSNTWQERMRIDIDGRVTMPHQPAFNARLGTSTATNLTGATIYYSLVCDVTAENRGGHFSTSTGRFTAPVSGMYLFTGHVLFTTTASGRETEFWFDVNSGAQRWFSDRKILASTAGSMQTVGGSVAIPLAANDYVIPRGFVLGGAQNVGIQGSPGVNSAISTFTGYLIG